MGSASELEYHLLLARDLKLIQPKKYEELAARATELKRMLTALLHKLNADRCVPKARPSRFQVS
jgi:four helix bundle protein